MGLYLGEMMLKVCDCVFHLPKQPRTLAAAGLSLFNAGALLLKKLLATNKDLGGALKIDHTVHIPRIVGTRTFNFCSSLRQR